MFEFEDDEPVDTEDDKERCDRCELSPCFCECFCLGCDQLSEECECGVNV